MASRPILYKCPNYQNCLTGYRGEPIEVYPEMAAVCPECGGALHPVPKPTPAYVAHFINLLTISILAGVAWLAWPKVAKFWNKPPPAPTAPTR
jgi:hypothetical protein